VAHRAQIERVLESRLGPAAPQPGAAETEVLRRFRSFAASALQRGEMAQPALDGLRANERRVAALLDAWSDAAAEVAGGGGEGLRASLAPLVERFHAALRSTGGARNKRGAVRSRRRAVMAAIDRVADAFLAIDADSGCVVDANPAAGALLGVARDALLGLEATALVPREAHQSWWVEIEAMAEGSEPRRFDSHLQHARGSRVSVHCTVTRFATRGRTLALVLARPT